MEDFSDFHTYLRSHLFKLISFLSLADGERWSWARARFFANEISRETIEPKGDAEVKNSRKKKQSRKIFHTEIHAVEASLVIIRNLCKLNVFLCTIRGSQTRWYFMHTYVCWGSDRYYELASKTWEIKFRLVLCILKKSRYVKLDDFGGIKIKIMCASMSHFHPQAASMHRRINMTCYSTTPHRMLISLHTLMEFLRIFRTL